jgi:hypothetical protein
MEEYVYDSQVKFNSFATYSHLQLITFLFSTPLSGGKNVRPKLLPAFSTPAVISSVPITAEKLAENPKLFTEKYVWNPKAYKTTRRPRYVVSNTTKPTRNTYSTWYSPTRNTYGTWYPSTVQYTVEDNEDSNEKVLQTVKIPPVRKYDAREYNVELGNPFDFIRRSAYTKEGVTHYVLSAAASAEAEAVAVTQNASHVLLVHSLPPEAQVIYIVLAGLLSLFICVLCCALFASIYVYRTKMQWERGKNKDSISLQSIPKEVKIIPKICQCVLNNECYLAHDCETRKLLDRTPIEPKRPMFLTNENFTKVDLHKVPSSESQINEEN